MNSYQAHPDQPHYPEFEPFPMLRNGHLMTIASALWRRKFPLVKKTSAKRYFEVEPGAKVLCNTHWQEGDIRKRPTVLLFHGLEGSNESTYILGTAEKALSRGMNVVRVNLRNCGGTEHLCPSLYHGGLSHDVLAIAQELKEQDGITDILLVGWSLGGNIVLKAVAELGAEARHMFSGVCAVSPPIDLSSAVTNMERGVSRLYQRRFLRDLKTKLKIKNKHFPKRYNLKGLKKITSIRDFDNHYTAPDAGFGTAANYYKMASSLPLLNRIEIPTLIIHAQDDPLVPFHAYEGDNIFSSYVQLLAPKHGGHVAFIQKVAEREHNLDRFWAENRVIEFCSELLKNHTGALQQH